MKNLAIWGFALTAVFWVACSNDYLSPDKDSVVSCRLNYIVDGVTYPLYCLQTHESQRDSLVDLCDLLDGDSQGTSMSNEGCDPFNAKKECVFPDDSLSSVFVYDKIAGKEECEEVLEDFFGVFSNDNGGEGNESEIVSYNASYFIPEKICVQFRVDANLQSSVKFHQGMPTVEDLTGKGALSVPSCDVVAYAPVVTCSDNETADAITIIFYDKNLKGKKCKDLVSFIPLQGKNDADENDGEE